MSVNCASIGPDGPVGTPGAEALTGIILAPFSRGTTTLAGMFVGVDGGATTRAGGTAPVVINVDRAVETAAEVADADAGTALDTRSLAEGFLILR